MHEGEEGGRGHSEFCGRSGWTFLLAPLMFLPELLETTQSRRVPALSADACVCRRNEIQSEKQHSLHRFLSLFPESTPTFVP